MPELPEVETVVRTLEHQLDRVMITGCEVFWNNIIGYPDAATFCRDIVGKTIQGYYRHGKYMRFDLGDMEWICHMRMEGKFYVQQPQEPYDKHVHVILQIHDELIFDVWEDELEQMRTIVEEGMQHAMKLRVPLIAEANIGRTWYDAK